MENNQQSNIFDEIIVYIGYVLLVPTFIGFLIGKLVTRCYYQALVNKRFHNKKILSLLLFFGFCLTLIFIGTFIFCILNIVLFKQVIWVYVVYALALNINFCILLLIPVALIINNSRINKFAKAFKKQYFFEILSKAKNRNNKNKSFNKLYLYFTDYELLKSVVEKYLKTLQSSEINESIGVIINKEHGICIPQDVLNRGTMVFGVTGGVKLTR